MRKRWKVKEAWEQPLFYMYALGWAPTSIVAQVLFARHGMAGKEMWPFGITVMAWFGPLVALVLVLCARWVFRIGSPIARVAEPVTTDLREAHRV